MVDVASAEAETDEGGRGVRVYCPRGNVGASEVRDIVLSRAEDDEQVRRLWL